jgi:uncharacterized protein (TIGR03437 family)
MTVATSPVSLTYAKGSGIATSTTTTVSASVDGTSYTAPSPVAWLTTSGDFTANTLVTTAGGDTLNLNLVTSYADYMPAGNSYSAVVPIVVGGTTKASVTVSLTVTAPQTLLTTSTLTFNYTVNGVVPGAQNGQVTVGTATNQNFAVDPTTVPPWLQVQVTAGATSTPANNVTFTPLQTTLGTGNYNTNVKFMAIGAAADTATIPVTLIIKNPTASISINGKPTNSSIVNIAGGLTATPLATDPTPVVTVVSTDPTTFTATCSVVSTNPGYVGANPCYLNGTNSNSVTAIAYSFGTPLTTTFDQNLFNAATPFGTVVNETVSVTAGGQTVTQIYSYSIQPLPAGLTGVSPTSAATVAAGDSLVLTLTGSNFVGSSSILPGDASMVPTVVFINGTACGACISTPISSTVMMVSVPSTVVPGITAGQSTATMTVGVGNQSTGTSLQITSGPTQKVTITKAPVVYAVTSTASYEQPNPGTPPSIVPYELVSIFGANFGTFSAGFATGALSANYQYGDTVNISGLGTTNSPYVTLGVTFKIGTNTYKAPILFANASQINCIVPSGLTVGQTAYVTVTSGTTSSDGLFAVTVVAAQPGIFTLTSDGTGQGAILNWPSMTVNGSANTTTAGNSVAIYVTGLGAPDSTHKDVALTPADSPAFPTDCSAISLTANAASPGYLQVANTDKAVTGWTPPTAPWTNIDGAVIYGGTNGTNGLLMGNILAPCMIDPITVIFDPNGSPTTATVANGHVGWAGFAAGSVAGLYQINVVIPAGTTTGNSVPVTVGITLSGTTYTSPAGATIAIQ